MTKVYARQKGSRYYLSANGHATGSEPVCAGVSALLYALAGYLTNAKEDGTVAINEWLIEDGNVLFFYDGGRETQAAYDLTIIGLQQIAQSYPQFIQVHILTA